MSAVRILLVCTGNICRSPLAAQLLRARFAALGLQAEVYSAGTRAMVASPMTDEAAALALKHGANSVEHSARQLTEQLVGDADLILTATRDHRREVVTLLPRSTRYTFTLNQFARLVSATETEPSASAFSAFVASIAASRGLHPSPNPPTLDDIDDPYRQSAAVYARVAALIDESVTTIAAALAPALREH